MYLVPCTPNGDSSWSQRTALDGTDYTLTFRWSQRDGHWLLDLADAERVAIRSGMLLAPNVDLLAGVIDNPPSAVQRSSRAMLSLIWRCASSTSSNGIR